MTLGAEITPAEIRAYANLPGEVPEALLSKHLRVAERDLIRATGIAAAPADLGEQWNEALIVRALASAFPWLNTFALDGAAKVGRLEGSVEYRFLNPDEVEARIEALTARYAALVVRLTAPEGEDTPPDAHNFGSIFMAAI